MNICANSAKLLRKIDHVLLWIMGNDTRLLQCSLCAKQRKFQWLAMFCFYTLPLARPAQAKIQILTAICICVKLIFWNKVNLSHLYRKKLYFPRWLEWRCITKSEQWLKFCTVKQNLRFSMENCLRKLQEIDNACLLCSIY